MKRIRNTSINNFENKSLNEIRSIVISYKQSQNLSPKTFDVYKRVFKEFDIYFDAHLNLYELKMREASQFIEFLLKDKVYYLDRFHNTGRVRGVKPTTVNTYLKVCKSIYQVLVDLEYIESNPFKKIKTVKRQEEKIKTIPEDDINKLIDSLDKNCYTDFRMIVIIHVLLDTFGRINEVLNIKIEDIDFETNTIYFGETKTNQYRYVPFSNKTKKLLLELIEETKEFRSDNIFLTQYRTIMTPNNLDHH
ncbi:site-specific integrase [Staphylococcus felis]|uniref:tyrosine-type recombinase/integrase n=1 Tax=Staphylococcus felis TaxID=46127 RepID=UPI003967B9D3